MQNPLKLLLVGLIRAYQVLLSPLLPSSCKYYPSCSRYALDAVERYGVLRGVVLAGWRVLRCNPLSYGGYDPVEAQSLFRKREPDRRDDADPGPMATQKKSGVFSRWHRRRTLTLTVILAILLLGVSVFAASCSFFGTATTSTAVTSTEGGTTDSSAGSTTTTVEEGRTAGFLAGPLKPLEAIFFWVLEKFHNIGISWSWAIVLLTVVVRIVLIPLTWRQIKSMRAMQALQPEIKALQEKYKDDRQVLNQKLMQFYQENKVSPFGSCLPLLLQLPVFFGLYYMLRTAGTAGLDPEAAGRWASIFAPGSEYFPVSWLWIPDITQFNMILMFLYIASQFVASWQMARKGAGQQKMIAYFMPIIVGIFMFIGRWPAGLFIYWFTSNLWTIAQQFVAERFFPLPAAAVAADAQGKGAVGKAGSAKRSVGKAGSAKGSSTKAVPAKSGSNKSQSAKGGAAKTGAAKSSATKQGSGKTGATKPGSAKPSAGKGGSTKGSSSKSGAVKGSSEGRPAGKKTAGQPTSTKSNPAQTSGGKKAAGTSGGKSSVQKIGKQGQEAAGKSERPDGGAGGPEGSS